MIAEAARRRGAVVAVTIAALVALTGCAREEAMPIYPSPTVHSVDARQALVELITASAEAVGGEWEVIDPLGREGCVGENLVDVYGMQWSYGLVRVDDTQPQGPEHDIPILEELWGRGGMRLERTRSGGERPDLGLVGRGGPVTESIGYLDSEFGGISISADSICALDDDPDRPRDRFEDLDDLDDTAPPSAQPVDVGPSDEMAPRAHGTSTARRRRDPGRPTGHDRTDEVSTERPSDRSRQDR